MKYGRGNLAKVLTVIIYSILLILLIMLLKVTYLPKKGIKHGPPPIIVDEPPVDEKAKLQPIKVDVFKKILTTRTEQKLEHFHNLDETVDIREYVPNLCLVCHGSLPHSKNKDTRALYNMHTYFCACEVCHLKGDKVFFTWFDTKTGLTIDKISERVKEQIPAGTYSGNYGAKIVPCILDGPKVLRLDQPVSEEYAKEYLKIWSQYTYDQQSQAKLEVHRQLTKEPVRCVDCHQKENPYLDFKRLGYPKHLCDEFVGTEVAGMVDKYKSLKLPTMFRPDEIIQQKQLRQTQGSEVSPMLPPTFRSQ
ncbi:hypothetical protein JXL19_05380 [bacterium]|nr:hypothetical protein [bacterium]